MIRRICAKTTLAIAEWWVWEQQLGAPPTPLPFRHSRTLSSSSTLLEQLPLRSSVVPSPASSTLRRDLDRVQLRGRDAKTGPLTDRAVAKRHGPAACEVLSVRDTGQGAVTGANSRREFDVPRRTDETRWPLLFPGCGPVSLFDCISFAHILALLGRAVKTRGLLIVNVCLRIHPYQSMSPAWCRSRGTSAADDRCCERRRAD